MAWRSLAAQGSSSSVALHTWPYAPEPSGASRMRRTEPKRIGGRGGCAMRRTYISETVARREEKKLPKVGGCGGEPAYIYTINEVSPRACV